MNPRPQDSRTDVYKRSRPFSFAAWEPGPTLGGPRASRWSLSCWLSASQQRTLFFVTPACHPNRYGWGRRLALRPAVVCFAVYAARARRAVLWLALIGCSGLTRCERLGLQSGRSLPRRSPSPPELPVLYHTPRRFCRGRSLLCSECRKPRPYACRVPLIDRTVRGPLIPTVPSTAASRTGTGCSRGG